MERETGVQPAPRPELRAWRSSRPCAPHHVLQAGLGSPSRASPLTYLAGVGGEGSRSKDTNPKARGALTSTSSPGDAPWPRKQKSKDAPAWGWAARDLPTPEAVRLHPAAVAVPGPQHSSARVEGSGRAGPKRPSVQRPTCSRCRRRRSSSCRSCSCLADSSSRSWALRRRSSSPVRCRRSSARCFLS